MRRKILGAVVEFDRLLGFVFGFDFTGGRFVVRCTVSRHDGLNIKLSADRQPKCYPSCTTAWLGTHYLQIWR